MKHLILFFILLTIVIICILAVFPISNNRNFNATEVSNAVIQKDFIVGRDIIEMPLDKYLIVKKTIDKKVYFLKISRFEKNKIIYQAIKAQKLEKNIFEILLIKQGSFNFSNFVLSRSEVFKNLYVAFLPVNSLVKYRGFLYGICDNHSDIKFEDNIIKLPTKISWYSSGTSNATRVREQRVP